MTRAEEAPTSGDGTGGWLRLRRRRPVSVRYPFTSALKTTLLAVDT